MKRVSYALTIAGCLLTFVSFSQSVGINTTGVAPSDPKAMLEIRKSGFSKLKLRSENFSDTAVLELSNRNTGNLGTDIQLSLLREEGLLLSSSSDIGSNTKDSLLSLKIGTGNLGIGVKNPVYPMQLHTPSAASSYMSFTNNSTGVSAADGLLLGINGNSAIIANLESGNLRLGTSNLTRLMIDATGNVGVGNLAPGYKLDINGDMNLTGAMRINGSAGTAGQVLTSNGTSDPQWKTTSFSNNTRFAVEIGLVSPATTFSSTGGILTIGTTKYNLDPASVSIGSSSITITKSGLYHFEAFYNIQFFYASAATALSPVLSSYVSVDYTGGFNHHIAYHQELQRHRSTNSWYYNGKASFDIYLQAPRVISFYSGLTSLDGPTNSVIQEGMFYGHLISE
jgi:hypothetical protein